MCLGFRYRTATAAIEKKRAGEQILAAQMRLKFKLCWVQHQTRAGAHRTWNMGGTALKLIPAHLLRVHPHRAQCFIGEGDKRVVTACVAVSQKDLQHVCAQLIFSGKTAAVLVDETNRP